MFTFKISIQQVTSYVLPILAFVKVHTYNTVIIERRQFHERLSIRQIKFGR